MMIFLFNNKKESLNRFLNRSQVEYRSAQCVPMVGTYLYNGVGSGVGLGWVTGQDLPVVKHTLREGLASCIAAKISRETCNANQTVQHSLQSKIYTLQSSVYLISNKGHCENKVTLLNSHVV